MNSIRWQILTIILAFAGYIDAHVKKALTITPEHKRATELTQTLKGKHR